MPLTSLFHRAWRQILVVFLLTSLGLTGFTNSGWSQSDALIRNNELPQYPNAIVKVPEWTAKHPAPFGLRSYFSSPSREKNGATHYLIAIREISTHVDRCFQKGQLFNTEEVERRQAVIERLYGNFDLLARFSEMEEKRELIKTLASCFERTQVAQSKSTCVFQSDFSTQQPHLDGMLLLAQAYQVKICVDAKDQQWETALDNIRRTLQIARDILPRANAAASITSSKIENIVARQMIPIVLMEKRNTKPSYCDRLIQILLDHQGARKVSGEIAIATEWLRLNSLLNDSKGAPAALQAARQDITRWFNESFFALQKSARQRDRELRAIHQNRLQPHERLFRAEPLDQALWLETVVHTQTDLVIGLLAVRKRYMTSRRMPRSLEDLFVELPKSTPPLDRLRENPLNRQSIKANFGGNIAVIYSVGVDGLDGKAEQGSDDLAVQIETTGPIKFLSDPFREAAKSRD